MVTVSCSCRVFGCDRYFDGSGASLSNNIALKGSYSMAYPYGKSLSNYDINSIVSAALTDGHLPKDADGIYVVLTSADVMQVTATIPLL